MCIRDSSRYDQPDYSDSARFVCAPPLRKQADQEALWAALADGTIQTVSTDHCSFTLTQKDAGKGDFTKIPGGLPGVETRGILLYSEGVAKGRIPAEKMEMCIRDSLHADHRHPAHGVPQAVPSGQFLIFAQKRAARMGSSF